jgi:hypothetical protein
MNITAADQEITSAEFLANIIRKRVIREDGTWDWRQLETALMFWFEMLSVEIPEPKRSTHYARQDYTPSLPSVFERRNPPGPVREPAAPQASRCRQPGCGGDLYGWPDGAKITWKHADESLDDHEPLPQGGETVT